jgi:hypothetical protein
MRITEFVSAADALAMWKVISDNTWAAIAQQEEAESRARAERAAARKSVSKRGVGKKSARPIQPKRLPPPLQHVTAPVPKDAKPAASAETKPTNPKQQQPALPNDASSNKAIQPIEPIAAAPSIANPAPVNATVKKPLPQPSFQRNLSNAAGQKTTSVTK